MSATATHQRHLPLRSCIVCRNKAAKAELVRIVATPEGAVTMDPTGKRPGRGAYVCKDGVCLSGGPKRGRFEYALRTKLKDMQWTELMASLEGLGTT